MRGYTQYQSDEDLTAHWLEWEDGTLQLFWIHTEDMAICDQQVAAKGQE